MLILDVLVESPNYGYQIAQTVLQRSDGYFELKEGSLYPALHRLERQKLLSSYWIEPEDGRRRKYYKVTANGIRAHQEKKKEWMQFSAGVKGVLGGAS